MKNILLLLLVTLGVACSPVADYDEITLVEEAIEEYESTVVEETTPVLVVEDITPVTYKEQDSLYASVIDIDDPYVYLDLFIQDAQRFAGIDLSYVYDMNIRIDLVDSGVFGINGIAFSACIAGEGSDNSVWIGINTAETKIWASGVFEDRLALLYHEFGHDILNLAHLGEEGDIMTSDPTLKPGYVAAPSLEEWKQRVIRMVTLEGQASLCD